MSAPMFNDVEKPATMSANPPEQHEARTRGDEAATSLQEAADLTDAKQDKKTQGSAEDAADKVYEERMEEEYAKREGGA